MARILLGVTGGIAAYKSLELTRLAMKAGHSVRVLMTPAAERFVGRQSFAGITGAPVLTDEFEPDALRGSFPGDAVPDHEPIGHLAVVANADAYLIAPASANTIAKLAAGMADSMVTTSFLACTAPRAVAPAMNDRMYGDPATQANLDTLRARGVTVIDPDSGALASRGEHGLGRLPEPRRLLETIDALLPHAPGPWDGLRVLVSAGGTREPLDSVRFIGNRSSGRMGIALAERAAARGAAVTLVTANVAFDAPAGVRRVDVETTAELAATLEAEARDAHVVLMAAAVADFRPASVPGGKLEREGEGIDLRLEKTEDVIAGLARSRPHGQTIVGFAAEHGETAIARARAKRERKGIDLVVFNDVSRREIGFDSEANEVTLVARDDERHVPLAPKDEIADAVLDRVQELRTGAGQPA
jgi:phosphopantothenoylcysteine decarboxylase / phosphopantothenate---cysteine ligase